MSDDYGNEQRKQPLVKSSINPEDRMQTYDNIPRATSNKNQAPESANTQRSKILGLLIAARGQWVPLSEISACACQYGARIFEARRLGFRIENRTKEIDGVRRSWFRLVPVQVEPATAPAAERVDSINSQAKPAGDVTSLPQQETLPFFPSGDR